MPGRNTLGHALVVAAVLHAGLFAIAERVRAERSPAASVPPLDVLTVEVAVEGPPVSPVPVVPAPSEPRREPQPVDAPGAFASRSPGRTSAAPVASAVVLPESEPASPGAWSLHVGSDPNARQAESRALESIGLAGTNRFMGRRETPEEEARAAHEEANRAAGEAMRTALHDRDVTLGLGGGGPVVTAIEAAVRESTAADESRAVVVAFADASGLVMRVDVESASDEGAFRSIADDVLKRLRGQRVRVPSGSHGLAMRIHIDSRLAAPSGGSAGLDAKSAGAHFDIADLGARARRVIHARVLEEQLL